MVAESVGVRGIGYQTVISVALVAMASGIGYLFRAMNLPEANIAIVYLLAVVLTARASSGYLLSLFMAVLSAFLFNFFFMEPYYTFSYNAPSYIITAVIMTITSFITSALTSHARLNQRKAQDKEAEIKALYTLTKRLSGASNLEDIASIVTAAASSVAEGNASCVCMDEKGFPETWFVQQEGHRQIFRTTEDSEQIIQSLGREAATQGDAYVDWPIRGREHVLGILRLPPATVATMDKAQDRLLHSVIESAALAMDRFRSVQQQIKTGEEAVQERYRGNLLRAISHDLRTPLSGIMGTAEMMMNMTDAEDPRYHLAEGIRKDASWLHSLVENILSLTRLQDGRLPLRKQLEAVEEVVGGAIGQVGKRAPGREITVRVPDELLLVSMDARLIQQVLINLIENAIKHTQWGGEIRIVVSKDKAARQAVFTVSDSGDGIDEADLPNIFVMFYTSLIRHTDARMGIGLGLAICDAIVRAHGGQITASNRIDGPGAEFTFTLPMEEAADEHIP